MNICLTKRSSAEVVAAAAPHKMDGWASAAAKELDDPDVPVFAIENDRHEIIGQAGLVIWPVGSSRATATIALFDPRCRGRGTGTQVIRMLLEHAFLKLHLPRVTVRVNADNPAAIRCYQKAGFVAVGSEKDNSVHMVAFRESRPRRRGDKRSSR